MILLEITLIYFEIVFLKVSLFYHGLITIFLIIIVDKFQVPFVN